MDHLDSRVNARWPDVLDLAGEPDGHAVATGGEDPADAGRIDLGRATLAAQHLLDALGVDTGRPGTARTAHRMASAYAEMLSPRPFTATTFPNEEGYSQLVIGRGIPFAALCEHHFLPFAGSAHIGYLPGERILGLSKFARLVQHFACRPQVQERLTQQIADWFDRHLAPRGVGVVLVAEHMCMAIRGVRAPGAETTTSALHGDVLNDPRTREEFFALAGVGR